MEINPMQLRGLPSLADAKQTMQRINFEATKNSDQMNDAGQKLEGLQHHLGNVLDQGIHPKFFDAEDHLYAALAAHNSGDYTAARGHVMDAQKAVREGDHALYSSGGFKEAGYARSGGVKRTAEMKAALDRFHGAVKDYHSYAAPAKLADSKATKAKGVVSVTVNPDYVARTNPAYAKEREKNQQRLKNRNALKETPRGK